ncbi:leucine-rich repeat domain-containing protein [Gimesia algae]|uniref:Internalin-A n=1 Tax=Gimesia algae TaxID=2527971 RepID=A0A517VDQ4_9PLAN|nr:hypothetical protein [Gimesia algae]QDT91129.1 Internalin-A precursor [Gimesia algae]
MGRLLRFKPERITGWHYVRWGATLILLLTLFFRIKNSYQKEVRDYTILRLEYQGQAHLYYHKSPLIPVPVNLPFNSPDWFYSEEVKVVDIRFKFKETPVDTLQGIESLKGLSHLDLSSSRFSSDPLIYLSELTYLDQLSLFDTNVEDAELAYLKNMKKLRMLNLTDSFITDQGLAHLKSLKNLEYLSLNKTDITDAGLVHLSELKKLRNLYLSNTSITDKGLMHLKGLKNLTILSLSNTEVTDAGLSHLKHLNQLQKLYLDHTQVSENEQHRWQIALEQRAEKYTGKEIQVKSRYSSRLDGLSHTGVISKPLPP